MSETKFLYWQMLMTPAGQYVIEEIKKPLMKAILELGKRGSWLGMLIALIQIIRIIKRYPEPTRENCTQPNTQRLLDIRDKFFECEDNPGRDALFQALWRMFIVEYEHDSYYRQRINWILREMGDWDYSEQPQECWKEGNI